MPRRPRHLDFLRHPPTRLRKQPDTPSSPAPPLTPPPRPSSTPSATSSPSSPGIRQDLTPPRRLYQRSFLHSPPLTPSNPVTQRLAEAKEFPPSLPEPWIWSCHLCNRTYRLGVTRRCLNDGHYFCAFPAPPLTSPPTVELNENSDTNTDTDTGGDGGSGPLMRKLQREKRERRERKRTRRKQRRVRSCRAEFDYGGWTEWNTWRAQIVKLEVAGRRYRREKGVSTRQNHRHHTREQQIGRMPLADEGMEMDRERNCWRDCEFPSQCLDERRLEWEWKQRRLLEEALAEETREAETERETPWHVLDKNEGMDDGGGKSGANGVLDISDRREGRLTPDDAGSVISAERGTQQRQQATVAERRHTTRRQQDTARKVGLSVMVDRSMELNSVKTLRIWEEEEEEGGNRNVGGRGEMQIDEMEQLGPIGTDSDGLGEGDRQALYTRSVKRRKKCSDHHGGGVSSPPRSPLKEEMTFPDEWPLVLEGGRLSGIVDLRGGGGGGERVVELDTPSPACGNCGQVFGDKRDPGFFGKAGACWICGGSLLSPGGGDGMENSSVEEKEGHDGREMKEALRTRHLFLEMVE